MILQYFDILSRCVLFFFCNLYSCNLLFNVYFFAELIYSSYLFNKYGFVLFGQKQSCRGLFKNIVTFNHLI